MTDNVQQQITWLRCFDDDEADHVGAARCANTMESQQARIESLRHDFDLATILRDEAISDLYTANNRIELLEAGLNAVNSLIDESEGVYGLHLNGDACPWTDILEGGFMEEWLIDFSKAIADCKPSTDSKALVK